MVIKINDYENWISYKKNTAKQIKSVIKNKIINR